MTHYVEDFFALQSDPKRKALLIQVAFEAHGMLADILAELKLITKELQDGRGELFQGGRGELARELDGNSRGLGVSQGKLGQPEKLPPSMRVGDSPKRSRGRPRKT